MSSYKAAFYTGVVPLRVPPRRPALACCLLTLAGSLAAALAQTPETALPALPLTNAAQIRQLTAAQAGQSLPARLQGVVVTEADPPPHRAVVIWDGTAGVYLLGPERQFEHIRRGDLLEAAGETDPGEFAPIVRVKTVRKLGSAPTPPARPVTYEELLSGGVDAQWVELTGVVRSLDLETPANSLQKWHMVLAVGGGKVSVVSNGPQPPGVAPDARVRLQGTCFYQFTQRRQVVRPVIFVPSEVPVQVEQPAPADGYAAPVRPLGSLLEFSPEGASGHRVHVRGVVTHQERSRLVWLHDNSGALRLQTRQTEPLEPGDEIDVLGFPAYGSYTPALEDAVFQKRRSGTPPPALPLPSLAAAFDHPTELIALDARLVVVEPFPDGWLLILEQNGTEFKALLRAANLLGPPPQWQPGSQVRVTGICSVVAEEAEPVLTGVWHPQSFQLLLRSPADVTVLRLPSWWTTRHLISLLLALTGASLVITGIVMWLARRRLHEQAQRRAMAEAEFAAILSERNRVAREIHDTLAQGLVATSVQLRLARKSALGAPEPLTQHLEAAQQLVRDNLEEARKSIWNMRSQVLENGDLASALEGILRQMAGGTGLKTHLRALGRPRRLAPVLENNILRVGQEAISNAVRHAHAREIAVDLQFEEREFCLTVQDNGQGFEPAQPPPGEGGFGLVGMRERAAHIQGELEIRSTRQTGTQLKLRVPLSAE